MKIKGYLNGGNHRGGYVYFDVLDKLPEIGDEYRQETVIKIFEANLDPEQDGDYIYKYDCYRIITDDVDFYGEHDETEWYVAVKYNTVMVTYSVVFAPFEFDQIYGLDIESVNEETVWEWYQESDRANVDRKEFETLEDAEKYFAENCQYPRTYYSESQHRITGELYYIVKEVWCEDPEDGIDYEEVLKYATAKATTK